MTRLALIFENDGFVKFSSDLPAPQLADLLNDSGWQPPDSVAGFFSGLEGRQIRAVALEDWVFALVQPHPSLQNKFKQESVKLSNRQRQVLDMLADGLTGKQIAFQLGLSRRTVNMHIVAIKKKLGSQTNAQSVSRGTALGYCRAYMRRREN